METTTINVRNQEGIVCDSTRAMLYSTDFNLLLFHFCKDVVAKDHEVHSFLVEHFSDRDNGEDGGAAFIDTWRISRVLLDIYNEDFSSISILGNMQVYKGSFYRFLNLLYNYCFSEYKPHLIVDDFVRNSQSIGIKIKSRQRLMNLIMDCYSKIVDTIEKL